MLNDNHVASLAEVEQENRRLRASLKKCQAMVADCRAKLSDQMDASAAQLANLDQATRGTAKARKNKR